MKLIYLGQAFECPARTPQTYRKPYAVNWRYQIPGEVYGEGTPPSSIDSSSKVISWRWQVPTA
jgi:hypothetical protein